MKYNRKNFHPHGKESNITEAIPCPVCERWIVEDFRLERENGKPDYVAYKQVNFDADRGFYYISNRSHSTRRCDFRKYRKENFIS